MKERVAQALRSETGQATIEYGILLGVLLIVVAAAVALFGQAIAGMFDRLIQMISTIGG